jgi:hypothetical protein
MSICPECGKKIRGANKIKIRGVWRHHHSSVRKPAKIKTRNLELENTHLTEEQLIKRLVESKYKGVN